MTRARTTALATSLGLAIVALGVVVAAEPSAIHGLTSAM